MFKFEPGQRYLMPVQFGPHPGSHSPQPEARLDRAEFPKRRTAFVHYLTRAEQLEAILPPGFELFGEPVISFEFTHHTEVPHLGGRGYGVFAVNYPARFVGKNESVTGMFRSVTWENMPDAIIWGREDLGCHKLYCDFGEPRILGNNYYYSAGMYGKEFFDMDLCGLERRDSALPILDYPFTGPPTIEGVRNDGLLFYKYIPKLNSPGIAEVEHAVLMSSNQAELTIIEQYTAASGSCRFRDVSWHDLPTYFHVVQALAKIELLEFRGASLTFSKGAMALTEMRAVY